MSPTVDVDLDFPYREDLVTYEPRNWPLNPDREKFTDQDVRNYPELQQLAEQYARNYEGDFDYLRAARHAVKTRGSLGVTEARGVLNCLRRDFKWQVRLDNIMNSIAFRENVTELIEPSCKVCGRTQDRGHAPGCRGVPMSTQPKPLSPTVKLRVDFWQRYLYSTHMYGKIIHVIDNNKSYAVWHRAENYIKFYPIVWCQGGSHPMVKYSKFKIITEQDENPLLTDNDKRVCQACLDRRLTFMREFTYPTYPNLQLQGKVQS